MEDQEFVKYKIKDEQELVKYKIKNETEEAEFKKTKIELIVFAIESLLDKRMVKISNFDIFTKILDQEKSSLEYTEKEIEDLKKQLITIIEP